MQKSKERCLDKAAVFRHQFYEAASRLEEEQGKNLKLRAQINVIMKTLLFLLQKQYDVKRSQTTGKKQAEDQAGSPPQRALPEKTGAYTASYSSSST